MRRLILQLLVPVIVAAPTAAAAAQSVPVSDHPQPGDAVRLRIWREPDLSGEFLIDETGTVVLPKLGPMRIADETAESLRQRVVEGYARFLNHTSIEVALLRRIQVLGAVRNPGLYAVDATMTVADALALAGGALPEVSPDRVELVRGGKRMDLRLTSDSRIADLPLRSGDQLYVPERNWISRNSGLVAAGLTASVSLIIALFTR